MLLARRAPLRIRTVSSTSSSGANPTDRSNPSGADLPIKPILFLKSAFIPPTMRKSMGMPTTAIVTVWVVVLLWLAANYVRWKRAARKIHEKLDKIGSSLDRIDLILDHIDTTLDRIS
jgi:hypothetical protein